MNEIIQTIAVYALPVLFAITLHEAAHAYAAKYFGDLTAYSQGRMSLNPVKHIDPFGTILIPLLLALVSSPFLFGYARPVPVDFARLRNPKKDMAWVALAGPAANLVMGLLWMALFFVMDATMKLLQLPIVLETTEQLGWPTSSVVPLAVILLGATLLYVAGCATEDDDTN